jgi:hypothetical protein
VTRPARKYGPGRRLCPKPKKQQETSLSSNDRIGRLTFRPYLGGVRAATGDHTPYPGLCSTLHYPMKKPPLLIKELADITGNDRYPFSPRIQTLRAIRANLDLRFLKHGQAS